MMQPQILCSMDSFLAAAGMSLLGYSEGYQRRLVMTFALSDMLATLAGVRLHAALAGNSIALLSLTVMIVAFLAFRRVTQDSALVLMIPVLLSLDNLLAGAAGSTVAEAPAALTAGVASGLLALAGFAVARSVSSAMSRPYAAAAGIALIMIPLIWAR